MEKYRTRKSSTLKPQYPAEQANPNGRHWKDHTNGCTLRDREFPLEAAPAVGTIADPPPLTPVSKHGSLLKDGKNLLLASRAKHDKGSFPS